MEPSEILSDSEGLKPEIKIQSHDTTTTRNGEHNVVNHIHREITEMERNRGSLVQVTPGFGNRIRPHRTRMVHQPRRAMRVPESVVATVLLTIIACNQIPKQTERKTIPIVDRNNEIHIYRSSVPLRLDNDYALYCMEHYTWETIRVRYTPTPLAKLRHEEYIVRKHPKS